MNVNSLKAARRGRSANALCSARRLPMRTATLCARENVQPTLDPHSAPAGAADLYPSQRKFHALRPSPRSGHYIRRPTSFSISQLGSLWWCVGARERRFTTRARRNSGISDMSPPAARRPVSTERLDSRNKGDVPRSI